MKPTPEQTHELATITKHPGWATLRKRVEDLPDATVQQIAERIMQGKYPTEIEAAYIRGYVAGVRRVIKEPIAALNAVNRLARGEQVEE